MADLAACGFGLKVVRVSVFCAAAKVNEAKGMDALIQKMKAKSARKCNGGQVKSRI